jgi:hypothetical protein
MTYRLFSLIALLCLASSLHAQSEAPAHYQLFGGYSYLSNSMNGVPGSRQSLNGWDASLAFPSWHGFRFKLDTSGYSGTNLGAPQHPLFILAGAQYNRRIRGETVFVDALAGDGSINNNWGAGKTHGETNSFTALAGGGLDTPLTRRIAFRVGGGFQYSYFALAPAGNLNIPYRIPGLPTFFGRLSTGLVWQF